MSHHQTDCSCDEMPQPLISTTQALTQLTESASVVSQTQLVVLDDALDRVLAKDVRATINVPGFDNSAMDGYVINLQEQQLGRESALVFELTQRIPAGSVGDALAPGCAARIFTGAPIPQGGNTVVMQEDCELIENGSKIKVCRPLAYLENIRPAGNDIKSGDVVLKAGSKLQAQSIALAASLGVNVLEVFAKIKVGVFFTGNELIEPGEVLKPGQIFNSNRYALAAMLKRLDCNIVNLGIVDDTLDATCEALEELSAQCDLIITSGGVSVGEEDHVKPAVERLGVLDLWRVKMKPGKPLAFGHVGKSAFIGLPGNPVSAMVTFLLFARPFIKKYQGLSQYLNTTTKVQANFDWHRSKARREFVRVRLDCSSVPIKANPYQKQGSDVLSSMVWADGLVEIPENTTFKQGEMLDYYSLSEMMS